MTQTEIPSVQDPAEAQAPGLRERKKQQTRSAMHRAALELVRAEGLANVTAEMIAARAGVSTRTFFNHWATKEAAIVGLWTDSREQVAELLAEALQAGTAPREALYTVVRRGIGSATADPELRDLRREVMDREPSLQVMSSGSLLETRMRLTDTLTEHLEGEDAHDRAVVAVELVFALGRSAFVIAMRRGLEPVEAFDQIVERYESGHLLV